MTPFRLVSPIVNIGAFTPMFFIWPSIPPLSVRQRLLAESNRINNVPPPPSSNFAVKLWRPSLPKFGLVALGTSFIYTRLFSRFSEWVLDMKVPQPREAFSFLGLEWTFHRQRRVNPNPNEAQADADAEDGIVHEEQEAVLQVHRPIPDDTGTPFANLDGVTQYPNISMMIGLLKPFVASAMGHLVYFGARNLPCWKPLRPLRIVLGVEDRGMSSVVAPYPTDNTLYWKYYTESAVRDMDPVWCVVLP